MPDLIATILRDPEAPAKIASDARGYLISAGAEAHDVERLAAQDPRRLTIYRKLVHRGIAGAIRDEMPRAAARLGPFEAWVSRFIDEEGPRSRYLRDVAFEFVAWATPLWAADPAVPSYLADLARHELSVIASGAEPSRDATDVAGVLTSPDLALDRGVLFHASAQLNRYAYAVHELSSSIDDSTEPARRDVALFAYRDADHEVRFLALSPLAARVVERLLGGATLGAAVEASAAALGFALDGAVLGSTAAVLTDLRDRGALLGASKNEVTSS